MALISSHSGSRLIDRDAPYKSLIAALWYCLFSVITLHATKVHAASELSLDTLTYMSLEDLMKLTVVSPSRKDEIAFGAAAAVHIITQDDIRGSGAVNIPEALRLAPGLHVARKDTNNYVVTSRGFNDLPYSDKLLVMIDGRAVHSQTFSHVWWPAINHPIEDIERIEVILGPGSALWGANAINGIINIITKQAKNAQGALGVIGGGNEEKAYGSLSVGWKAGERLFVKAYAAIQEVDGGRRVGGEWSDWSEISKGAYDAGPSATGKRSANAGFRADWELEQMSISLLGGAYSVEAGSEGAVYLDYHEPTVHFQFTDVYSGKNLTWLAEYTFNESLRSSLQVYYDNATTRKIFFSESLETLDAEWKLNYSPWSENTLVAGVDFRSVRTDFTNTNALSMPDLSNTLLGVYAQDEQRLMDGMLRLTAGAKVEKNDYSRWEFQPSVKAAVNGGSWAAWVSMARTVRLSNPVNQEFEWKFQSDTYEDLPLLRSIKGSAGVESEEAYTYEIGLRGRPSGAATLDLSLFYNQYSNVMDYTHTADPVLTLAPDPHYVQDLMFVNLYEGASYGGELSVKAWFTQWLRGYAGYSHTRMALRPKPGQEHHQTEVDWINTATPVKSLRAGFFIDLPNRIQLNPFVYMVDATPGVTAEYYNRFDLTMTWRPTRGVELSLQGRNIGGKLHREHESAFMEESAWIAPDYMLKVTCRY